MNGMKCYVWPEEVKGSNKSISVGTSVADFKRGLNQHTITHTSLSGWREQRAKLDY